MRPSRRLMPYPLRCAQQLNQLQRQRNQTSQSFNVDGHIAPAQCSFAANGNTDPGGAGSSRTQLKTGAQKIYHCCQLFDGYSKHVSTYIVLTRYAA